MASSPSLILTLQVILAAKYRKNSVGSMPLHTESIVYILLDDDDNDNNTPPRNKRQKRRKKVQKIQAIAKNHIENRFATTKAIEPILGGEQRGKNVVFFFLILRTN